MTETETKQQVDTLPAETTGLLASGKECGSVTGTTLDQTSDVETTFDENDEVITALNEIENVKTTSDENKDADTTVTETITGTASPQTCVTEDFNIASSSIQSANENKDQTVSLEHNESTTSDPVKESGK